MTNVSLALEIFLLITATWMAFFAMDDLLIDILAFLKKAKPEKLSSSLLNQIQSFPEKKIAIMIANWKEEDVLETMVIGNFANVSYNNFYFFLGVYPNDTTTRVVAEKLAKQNSQVKIVVNSKPGPTSKGQMINECVRQIFIEEERLGFNFDIFMIHDSEDMIHPLSLRLINYFITQSDYIQLPVYSLELPKKQLVGATYLDEFSEYHSKELILRSKMNQAVPSAGTGTALSRKLIATLLDIQNGSFLKEDTLTEDYYLGNLSHQLNFKTQFLCYYLEHSNKERDFIATREYFPKKISTSVRQKARWCIGIIFQGTRSLGWTGPLLNRYFLWRDRRGFFNAILITCSALILIIYAANNFDWPGDTHLLGLSAFQNLIFFNFFNFAYRTARRMQMVAFVNSAQQALMVPIRWPLANFINTIASFVALRDFSLAEWNGETPKWTKTQHEVPANFKTVFKTHQMLDDMKQSQTKGDTL